MQNVIVWLLNAKGERLAGHTVEASEQLVVGLEVTTGLDDREAGVAYAASPATLHKLDVETLAKRGMIVIPLKQPTAA